MYSNPCSYKLWWKQHKLASDVQAKHLLHQVLLPTAHSAAPFFFLCLYYGIVHSTIYPLKVFNSVVFSIFTDLFMFLSFLSPVLVLAFLWPTSKLKGSFIRKPMIWNDLVLLLVKCHKQPALTELCCNTLGGCNHFTLLKLI